MPKTVKQHPKELVHNDVIRPAVSKAAVRKLAMDYIRTQPFYRRRSNELQCLLSINENDGDLFRYEDFEALLKKPLANSLPVSPENILKNRREFQAVFRFLHPSTRLTREEITLDENQTVVLARYGTGKVFKPDGTELSYQDLEQFSAFKAAAAHMRLKLNLPANEALKDSFSQETLLDIYSRNPEELIVADGILVKKSSLVDMIDHYYGDNQFYNTSHHLAPFHDTEISEATLAQLPAETAEKVRAAKQKYLAAQNDEASFDFLNSVRAILLEMANAQRDGNIFLRDQQAEGQLGDLNQRLVLLFAAELERRPQLAAREIQTVWLNNHVLRLSISALLQEQPCIKLRQIYLWKFLHDNCEHFPANQPLILPPLVRQLCDAERYNFNAMFEGAPLAQPEPRAQNPAGLFLPANELILINTNRLNPDAAILDALFATFQMTAQQLLAGFQLHNQHNDHNPLAQLALPMLAQGLGNLRDWFNPRNAHQDDDLNRREFEPG